MADTMTISERTIMNIRERASRLENERRTAYKTRLSEIVAETMKWDIPKEIIPMKIAERAFELGFDCGCNKMYEYL